MTSNTITTQTTTPPAPHPTGPAQVGAMAKRTFLSRRLWQAASLGLAALALAACTAISTSYNNAPTLITWWADSYFDLDSDQEAALKDKLRALRVWHRTQLPEYARALSDVQGRIQRPVEPADAAWLFDQGERAMRRLAEHASLDAADLAMQLRQDNIAALEKKLAKNNSEFEKDYIKAALEKRQDKRYDKVIKEAERWYGSFSREQEHKIRLMTDTLPANYPLVLEDRKRRHAELVSILTAAVNHTATREQVAQRLRVWAGDLDHGRTPAYRDYFARYKAESQKMAAAIANMATAEQRETAQANLQHYMDDFNTLAVAKN